MGRIYFDRQMHVPGSRPYLYIKLKLLIYSQFLIIDINLLTKIGPGIFILGEKKISTTLCPSELIRIAPLAFEVAGIPYTSIPV